MKKLNHSIIKTALLFSVAAGVSSCQDWLTVYPQSQIVEENMWEDKNDLEGVRYSAYQQMCSTIDKLILWGDLRSDSYSINNADQDNGTSSLYQEIRDGRIERDSASTYFEWGGVYQTINICNKVLQHGAEVLEKDKQFTTAEWLQMKAEVTGLRALNYFYLIRAFKDVPYSTKVINNDTEVMYLPATNQLVVLDSLILDVESVKGKARNRFSRVADTKGLITNAALYAMLSDMYLWRASLRHGRSGNLDAIDTVYINNIPGREGSYVVHKVRDDYQLAIAYADTALAKLTIQNDRSNRAYGSVSYETEDYGLTNCDLYKNNFENFTTGNAPDLRAYIEIFSGTSEEAIFELPFNQAEERGHSLNGGDNDGGIWGYANKTHLTVSTGTLSRIYTDGNERNRDSRMWFSAWNQAIGQSMGLPGYYCFKWSNTSAFSRSELQVPTSHLCGEIKINTRATSNYTNVPIYRMSDVMLQKAEALAVLNASKQGEAMRYVNAIHRRWYCNDNRNITKQPDLDVTDNNGKLYATGNEATLGNAPAAASDEIAVLNERQLEFLGEGKRWFDLVRYAERHAGGPDGTQDPRAADTKDWDGNTRAQKFPEWVNEAEGTNSGLEGVKLMVTTFMAAEYGNEKSKALINRFRNRYGLYNLIYYKEIMANGGILEQNPVWNKSLYD
ncbi:MAG: RagB/SusD family nutrient uptake outer membrane protein [Bacteroidaceae bacterium]|nr:RagB/SusD family nutrient uptake outer membrane protein [Bacteroidaceae bacterium]MBR1788707.1 RagB/SusD family nutrient uptake outer membrane protein [Bacteroidaceae bacterium]